MPKKRLPFDEAIDYLASKTNLDTDSWIEGQGIVQDVAFTVAGAKGQILQDIRDAVTLAIEQGISIADFAKKFDTIADRYVNNWQLKGDRAWRGQLIYEQNLRQAYGAGRYAQMTEPETLKRRPYWQWRHGGTRNPRLNHLALDGRVFPADSLPFHAPCGFGCKCQVFSLSQRDVDRDGLNVERLQLGQDLQVIDPSNGTTRTVTLQPDPGFLHKPGSSSATRRQEVWENISRNLDPGIQASARLEADPVRLRQDRLDQRRKIIVAAAGESAVRKAEQVVQKALASTKIYIQISPAALEQIVSDGRFKSAFEINEKEVDLIEVRRSAEELMYGYPPNHPTIQRPVSGFLATSSKLDEAPLIRDWNPYGSIEIELRRSVKNNATFTLNDSLTPPEPEQRGQEISWQPSKLLDINIASIISIKDLSREAIQDKIAQFSKVKTPRDIALLKQSIYGYNFYMEVGLHGGINTQSIAKINYRQGSPSTAISEWAAINNVAIEVLGSG